MSNQTVDPVNEMMPWYKLIFLGLQHVLVMYAGSVVVPLIVGRAMKLSQEEIAVLVNADLFAAGIVTLLQTLGAWKLGSRLPVVMGVSFVSVGPMLAMAANPDVGITGIYGSIIVAGLFGICLSPLITKLLRFFPMVVSGSIILLLGICIVPIGLGWIGGSAKAGDPAGTVNMLISLGVLVLILAILRLGKGLWRNSAVLIGIVAGYLVCLALGKVSFDTVLSAPWVGVVTPFHFGMPTFHLGAIISMCIAMTVLLIESTGMFLGVGQIVGQPMTKPRMTSSLMADGVGAVFGGIFNTFPYTTYTTNIALLTITGVRSRYVCATGGAILIVLGLLPKLAHIVATVPLYVLGGAGMIMFGLIIGAGVRMLSSVDFVTNRHNQVIVAVSCCTAMIPQLAPQILSHFPDWMSPFTHSGILLGALSAFVLNLCLNGAGKEEHGAEKEVREAALAGVRE